MTPPVIIAPSPSPWQVGASPVPPGTIYGVPCYDAGCAPSISAVPLPCRCPLQSVPVAPPKPPSPPSPPSPPPPPPLLPPPPPPPGCVIDSTLPVAYTSAALTLPAGAGPLTNAVAEANTSTYPYFITWYGANAQVGLLDLSGQDRAPGGTWRYQGQISTAQAVQTGCSIFAVPPAPPPPPPQFPGCDDTVYFILAVPGSEEWCAQLKATLSAIRDVATQILSFITTRLEDAETVGFEWVQAGEKMHASLTAPFDGILGAFQELAGYLLEGAAFAMRKLICYIYSGSFRSDKCDPNTYASVIILKIAWETVKSSEIGVNFGVKAKVDFRGRDLIPLIDRSLEYLVEYLCPTEIPGVGEIMEAYSYGRINYDLYECWMRMRGADVDVWKPVLDTRREQLKGWEPIEYVRRQSLGNTSVWNPNSPFILDEQKTEENWLKESRAALRNIGWIYQTDQDQFISVYDELPTIAQHLHWLARNVDDAEYVWEYGLLDGFSTDADCGQILGGVAYERQPQVKNRNFWATFGPELRAQGMRKIDAAREYAAHWLHAAPVQLQHFMWRMRPGRQLKDWELGIAASMGWPVPVDGTAPPQMTFTTYDYTRILSEQDYAPKDVGWFASTMFQVPALSYVRDMYRYGIIDETQLAGYHQDLGYSPQDSDRFVEVDRSIKARIRMAEAHGWTPIALSNAYALGMITEDQDAQWMKYQGFSDDEINAHQDAASYQLRASMLRRAMSYSLSRLLNQLLAAYGEGLSGADDATAALRNLGIPGERAASMLATVDLSRNVALARQTKAAIKRGYLRGSLTQAEAQTALSSFLPNPGVVATTLDAWNIQRVTTESAPTKADIKRYLKENLITPDEAQTRLANLGMRADSVDLILAEYQYLMDSAEKKIEAKKEAQAEKEKLAQQKQIAAQEKAAAAAAQKEQKAETEAEQKAALAAQRAEQRAAAAALHAEQAQQRILTRRQAQQSRALVLAARQAEEMQARIVAALRKDEPPSKLDKWAQLGLIDKSYYTQRMSLYGYTEEAIGRSWEAACAKSTAQCVVAADGQPGVGTATDASAAAAITTAAVTAEWAGLDAAQSAAANPGQ